MLHGGRSGAFDAIGASLNDSRDLGAEGDAPAERIGGQLFTPGVFRALGIRPLIGRVFSGDEERAGDTGSAVVISHRLWTRRFGADPAVLGRQVRLNGVATAIVGVMPPEFAYPDRRADYWAPLLVSPAQLPGSPRFYRVIGRLKRGVTVRLAEADLQAVHATVASEFPDRKGWRVRLQPIRDALFGWTLAPLLTLQVAVALILLIACANVAGLLLARGTARGPEIALRRALGAGRGRIIRQLLAESLLLSLIGGAAGIVVAWWGVRAFVVMNPPLGAPAIGELALTSRMLGLTVLLAGATSVLFGLGPALASSKSSLTAPIHELTRSTGTARQQHLRGGLVAVQISLALILLVGAGLLVRSFVRLAERELNFEPRGLLTFAPHSSRRVPAAVGLVSRVPALRDCPQPSLVMGAGMTGSARCLGPCRSPGFRIDR
jgi:putative ABC transport system permease protein